MKNIHSVLDSQETEAWQKLIRVLTHEIMNSITPVTSLSELLEHQIEDFDGNEEERAEIRLRGGSVATWTRADKRNNGVETPINQPAT